MGVVRAQVGGTGIHEAVKLRLAATVIGVADGTVLLIMASGLDDIDSFRFQGFLMATKRFGTELS